VGSPRRFATAMLVAAAVGAATIGVTAAVADQDEQVTAGSDDTSLLERLDALEAQLPDPYGEVDEDEDWDVYADEFANLKGSLTTVEDDLRRLFVDGDEAETDVAAAVSLIASGWLDIMHAADAFATWSSHDLAFPLGTTDDDGVATGADNLRGTAERGLVLFLQGAGKHLEGYTSLRELSATDGAAQGVIDERAADTERFDTVDRPIIAFLLSQASPTVVVPLERFETQGPGVESRAGSMSYVCVDRELLEAEERPLTDEVLLELEAATPDRVDCAELGEDDELD
jgi:hypothetical protein